MSTAPQPSEPVVVSLFAEIHPFEEEITFSRTEWNGMTRAQRGEAIRDALDQAISDHGGSGWHIRSGATQDEAD